MPQTHIFFSNRLWGVFIEVVRTMLKEEIYPDELLHEVETGPLIMEEISDENGEVRVKVQTQTGAGFMVKLSKRDLDIVTAHPPEVEKVKGTIYMLKSDFFEGIIKKGFTKDNLEENFVPINPELPGFHYWEAKGE